MFGLPESACYSNDSHGRGFKEETGGISIAKNLMAPLYSDLAFLKNNYFS
jgi:hypothetical protein